MKAREKNIASATRKRRNNVKMTSTAVIYIQMSCTSRPRNGALGSPKIAASMGHRTNIAIVPTPARMHRARERLANLPVNRSNWTLGRSPWDRGAGSNHNREAIWAIRVRRDERILSHSAHAAPPNWERATPHRFRAYCPSGCPACSISARKKRRHQPLAARLSATG